MVSFFRRSQEKKKDSRILRVGLLNPVRTLDPRDAQDTVSVLVLVQIFETPYAPPAADEPAEALLFDGPLREERAEGGRQVYSAGLRPGVRFADGTPLTAAHVVRSLSGAEGFVEQAEARADGERVRFVLHRPTRRFDLVLCQHFCSIVLEKGSERLGTGPYQIAPDATPERMRLVRNPHHWQDFPIDELEFVYFPPSAGGAPERLLAALEAGEIHFSNALSRDDVAKLQQVRKWFQPGNSTASLYFNTERSHLRDARVRRALPLAIDRGELARICYENALAFTATSLLPPMMGAWRDGIRHTPRQARELLAEAAAPLPASLRMLMPWGPRSYLPQPQQVGAAVACQLGEVGVRVDQEPTQDSQQFYRRCAHGDFDLALIGWIADTADPADFLEANLSSRSIPEPGKSPAIRANMSRWRDSQIDALLARYREDPSEGNKVAVLERVGEEVPLLPLMYGPTIAVHSWRLKGFSPSPIGFPIFSRLDLEA